MLYMVILTWDPDKRDEVIKRAQKIGLEHEGEKVIGTWVDIQGGRGFQLVETPPDVDPRIVVKNNFAWNDILKIESVAVMDAAEMIKLAASM
jgi:hypothetical protein